MEPTKLIGEIAALRVQPDEVLIITYNPGAATEDDAQEIAAMLSDALATVGLGNRSMVLAGGDVKMAVVKKADAEHGSPPPPPPGRQ